MVSRRLLHLLISYNTNWSTLFSYLLDNIAEAFCNVIVTKRLPTCEHLAEMRCSDDPALYICTQVCGGVLACCGRDCKSNCHTCQEQNGLHELEEARRIKRTSHIQHPCHKPLRCAHECLESCSQDHKCVVLCKEQCRQECSHARCQEYCSTPCAPCQEPCTWSVLAGLDLLSITEHATLGGVPIIAAHYLVDL